MTRDPASPRGARRDDRGERAPGGLIAGADLAHVGPRFAIPSRCRRPSWPRLAGEDGRCSRRSRAGDAEAFFDRVARDGDRRRICGLSPIYALLRALGGTRGTLRRYAQWPDPEGVVTFASVVFDAT